MKCKECGRVIGSNEEFYINKDDECLCNDCADDVIQCEWSMQIDSRDYYDCYSAESQEYYHFCQIGG